MGPMERSRRLNGVVAVEDPSLPDEGVRVTHTDSGYASVSKPKPEANDTAKDQETDDDARRQTEYATDEIDALTEYSAATTTADQVGAYMNKLCADIYNKVRCCVDVHEWPIICRALPDIVKAFAVKLGRGDSQASRVVMYFIHKYHR